MESKQKNAKLSTLKPVSDHVKLAVHLVNPSSPSVKKSQQAAGYNIEGCLFLWFFFLFLATLPYMHHPSISTDCGCTYS